MLRTVSTPISALTQFSIGSRCERRGCTLSQSCKPQSEQSASGFELQQLLVTARTLLPCCPPKMKKCGKLKRSPGLCGSACAALRQAKFVQPRSTSSRLSCCCGCQLGDACPPETVMLLITVCGQLPCLQRGWVGGWVGSRGRQGGPPGAAGGGRLCCMNRSIGLPHSPEGCYQGSRSQQGGSQQGGSHCRVRALRLRPRAAGAMSGGERSRWTEGAAAVQQVQPPASPPPPCHLPIGNNGRH